MDESMMNEVIIASSPGHSLARFFVTALSLAGGHVHEEAVVLTTCCVLL